MQVALHRAHQGLSALLVRLWAGHRYGLYSSLEPDTHPAGVRLNLASAGNHVALIWLLVLFFFLGVKEGIM